MQESLPSSLNRLGSLCNLHLSLLLVHQEAGVKECWRLGLSDEASQLLRHLTKSRETWNAGHGRKKRSHAAMLGLHGLPELALAM